jgi:hypothetical protein
MLKNDIYPLISPTFFPQYHKLSVNNFFFYKANYLSLIATFYLLNVEVGSISMLGFFLLFKLLILNSNTTESFMSNVLISSLSNLENPI